MSDQGNQALRHGGVYNVGFAVHDDNITTRGHHVSFVRTLGLGLIARNEQVECFIMDSADRLPSEN